MPSLSQWSVADIVRAESACADLQDLGAKYGDLDPEFLAKASSLAVDVTRALEERPVRPVPAFADERRGLSLAAGQSADELPDSEIKNLVTLIQEVVQGNPIAAALVLAACVVTRNDGLTAEQAEVLELLIAGLLQRNPLAEAVVLSARSILAGKEEEPGGDGKRM